MAGRHIVSVPEPASKGSRVGGVIGKSSNFTEVVIDRLELGQVRHCGDKVLQRVLDLAQKGLLVIGKILPNDQEVRWDTLFRDSADVPVCSSNLFVASEKRFCCSAGLILRDRSRDLPRRRDVHPKVCVWHTLVADQVPEDRLNSGAVALETLHGDVQCFLGGLISSVLKDTVSPAHVRTKIALDHLFDRPVQRVVFGYGAPVPTHKVSTQDVLAESIDHGAHLFDIATQRIWYALEKFVLPLEVFCDQKFFNCIQRVRSGQRGDPGRQPVHLLQDTVQASVYTSGECQGFLHPGLLYSRAEKSCVRHLLRQHTPISERCQRVANKLPEGAYISANTEGLFKASKTRRHRTRSCPHSPRSSHRSEVPEPRNTVHGHRSPTEASSGCAHHDGSHHLTDTTFDTDTQFVPYPAERFVAPLKTYGLVAIRWTAFEKVADCRCVVGGHHRINYPCRAHLTKRRPEPSHLRDSADDFNRDPCGEDELSYDFGQLSGDSNGV